MKKILTTKKRIVIAVGASAVVLGSGGAAFAYYLSTGSGTGTAAVGTTSGSDLKLTAAPISAAMYPGDSDTVTVTVQNTTSHALSFNTVTATGATASGGNDTTDILDSAGTNPVSGCLASWFGGTYTAASPVNVPANSDTVTVPVQVTFTNDATTNQDACQKATTGVELNYQITG